MRRSPTPVTAWPAIADLMTLFAIVGLVAAAVVGARAASVRKEARALQAEVDDLKTRAADLEERLSEAEKDQGIDLPPCLGRTSGGGVTRLLRVTVNRGYRLEQLWLPKDAEEGATAPSLLTDQPAGELSRAEFLDRAKRIYVFGDRPDTFDRRCRFYVELKRGASISAESYAAALSVVNAYFLIGNSSEVNRELARGE